MNKLIAYLNDLEAVVEITEWEPSYVVRPELVFDGKEGVIIGKVKLLKESKGHNNKNITKKRKAWWVKALPVKEIAKLKVDGII